MIAAMWLSQGGQITTSCDYSAGVLNVCWEWVYKWLDNDGLETHLIVEVLLSFIAQLNNLDVTKK